MDLNELGRLFGVNGRQIGLRLKTLGLRSQWGAPTRQAEDRQLIDYSYERHGTYTKLWHVVRTVKLLEDAGLELASPAPTDLLEPPVLVGPFCIAELKHDQWQIVGSNGETAIVVTGEGNARVVMRVMNVAHRAEVLARKLPN